MLAQPSQAVLGTGEENPEVEGCRVCSLMTSVVIQIGGLFKVLVCYLYHIRRSCVFVHVLFGFTQEPKIKEQIRKVASMASLAAVCEIMGGKLEAHLESLPSVDALKKFVSFSQFNEVLKKPSYVEEKNRYVC